MLSRYLSPVVEIGMCYMLNVFVLSRYLSPVIEVLIILSVMLDVKCLCVVSLPQSSSRDWYVLYVKCLCVVSLPQSSSRGLDYPCSVPEIKKYKEIKRYLNVKMLFFPQVSL